MQHTEFARRIVEMQSTLYRVSTTLLPQLCDREDAVQSALEKAWAKRERLRDDRALRAWVIRILINECHAMLRRRGRETLSDTLPDREVAQDAEPTLYHLFTALHEKYRLPLLLHYMEGYSVREISAMLRLPAGTVKSQLHRGRRLLGDLLDAEEERP